MKLCFYIDTCTAWSSSHNDILKSICYIHSFVLGDDTNYHPAPWINARLAEKQPEYIWYWMREGLWQLPRSCMEIQMRGLQTTTLNGIGLKLNYWIAYKSLEVTVYV